MVSELSYVLRSGYHESPSEYDNLDWFVDKVLQLEIKMGFCFKITNKEAIVTDDD